ncbi:putative integral membrane protein [Alloactinosynnema sp. L-07]|uniref:hypothetical protein n=1 Tax=Alloactinosynnema sp. L-07 TaxID=1653480 RepID=UPI00065EF1D8|nr:hypothetical protein [Alloactinosynnema sp. L-07]CRK58240.1 putative integral membrane protein [Alloactinosynnema sp. L-07]
MDAANLFDSKTTYRLIRLEYLAALALSMYLFVDHIGEINWFVFAGLFLYIDLIGYIPGAIAFHRSTTKQISKVYYVLYNTMHSLVTQAAVALVWSLAFGPEWALLALPIHLCGDRALFGNFLKPFSVTFEPVVHPAFAQLREKVESPASASAPAPSAVAEQVLTG